MEDFFKFAIITVAVLFAVLSVLVLGTCEKTAPTNTPAFVESLK